MGGLIQQGRGRKIDTHKSRQHADPDKTRPHDRTDPMNPILRTPAIPKQAGGDEKRPGNHGR